MSTIASTGRPAQKPSLEAAFRRALTDSSTRKAVRDLMGWDDSQASRFLSGQTGLTIDKIDAAITAVGMVTSTPKYMDFLAYGAGIGANCHCARQGMGECGGV